MVQHVKSCRAELNLVTLLREENVLEQREIQVRKTRSTQGIAAQVAKNSGRGERETVDVDVVVGLAGISRVRRTTRTWVEVRPLAPGGAVHTAISCESSVGSQLDGKWNAGVSGKDAAEFPATQSATSYAVEGFGDGNVPSAVQNKVVGDIEIGNAILQVRNEGV